jgi:hypothetical protein
VGDEEWNESVSQPFDDVQIGWAEEVRRRIAELESGEVKPVPWDEARRAITHGDPR